ncbi:MAG: hypothetical protein QG599_2124 [Pseudomonadota bacterium]|nr:hypothetical protein [Pseudomonadota bacterium]
MNKLAGGVIGVVIVAAAGMTGAMYWSGLQAERWYEEALAEGSKGGNVKLSTVRYQRGVFSSQIMTRVDIPPTESGADSSFSIRQTVYHGPWPLAGWGTSGVPMQMTGAVVRATLDPESSAWTRQLAKWYGNQEPVVAFSQIAFDGASSTRITMPTLTLNDVEDLKSLNYSGLQGQFQVGPKVATVQGNLTVTSLEFVGKPEAASDGQPATGSEQVKLRDLALTVDQRQGPFNLLFGESSFKIAELRAQDQTPGSTFAMTGLSVTGVLTQQGSQQVAGELRIKADQITADQQSGNGSLHLALRHLDGPTLEKLQQWQQKASSPADDPKALLTLMKTLLAGKPEFMLDSQAKMTQGDWQGKLTLNFQDFDEAKVLQDTSGVLGALEKGLAHVEASKNLVETLLTDQIADQLQSHAEAQQPPVDPQMLQNMAATQATQQLQGLITDGFIQLDGDRYKTIARFEGGKLFVNDKEIPLTPPAGSAEMPLHQP